MLSWCMIHSEHKSEVAMPLGPVGVYQAFCCCLSTDYSLYISLGIPDYARSQNKLPYGLVTIQLRAHVTPETVVTVGGATPFTGHAGHIPLYA